MITSWRKAITPRQEVLDGNYSMSSFAADLGEVYAGRGGEDYRNPSEFFAMTHKTEGLRRLLERAVNRVCGRGGDPVIQIKTAFGGGKTHSMLAVYHLMRHGAALREVNEIAGVKDLPEVKVSVLAFNKINPLLPEEVKGTRARTLYGVMAAQLGGYDYVRENDIKGISPGGETLRKMFEDLGPCVVLMDELVAYGRKLHGAKNLAEGTYGNFMSFLQELTEAVCTSKNSLLVAALPESSIEAGGSEGMYVLEEIGKIFGRIESVWRPVTADEGFEIVKKRLFRSKIDEKIVNETAEAFMNMYQDNPHDFPPEAGESNYRKKIISCYPIHPEVFERLYDDWSTLENFQRTRGVLRFMAKVIHELWSKNDDNALIMPGTLPLYESHVNEELISSLYGKDAWNGVIAGDIDGDNSIPYRRDTAGSSRFKNVSACRKAARTVMLGSAPSVRGQSVRGIERSRILLGAVQPGDNISVFNDALNELKNELSFMYSDASGNMYWFDTRPTLQKQVRDREGQIRENEIQHEIISRLKDNAKRKGLFAGIFVCPKNDGFDVPDDKQGVRLVILAPDAVNGENAEISARKILDNHGNNRRAYRNTLIFLAPDGVKLHELRKKVRTYLAWKSIDASRKSMDLSERQSSDIDSSIRRFNEEVSVGILGAWSWLMMPYTNPEKRNEDAVEWESAELGAVSGGDIAGAVISAMRAKHMPVDEWKGKPLDMEMRNNNLWQGEDYLRISRLWEYLCSYCYLPKMMNYGLLEAAINDGMKEYFALAEDVKEEKYIGLKIDDFIGSVNMSAYLVKKEAAMNQIHAESQDSISGESDDEIKSKHIPSEHIPEEEKTPIRQEREKRFTEFHLPAKMDVATLKRDAGKLADEVIANLVGLGRIDITLEIHFYADKEIPKDIAECIADNCNNLKYTNYEFEEE